MADVFDMDPKMLGNIGAELTKLSAASSQGEMNVQRLNKAMKELALIQAQMQDVTVKVDPNVVDRMRKLVDFAQKLGVSQEQFNELVEKENQLRGNSFMLMGKLTKAEQNALDKKLKTLKEERDIRVCVGNQIISLGSKQQIQQANQSGLHKAVVGHLKEQGREFAGLVKSLTLSNLSIGFLFAKTLELYNMQRKISGMAAQTAYHWGGGAKNVKIAHNEINKLRLQFHMSAEESGNFVKDLAKSGVNALALSRHVSKTQEYTKRLNNEQAINNTMLFKLLPYQKQLATLAGQKTIQLKREFGLGEMIMANELRSGMERGSQVKYMQRLIKEENLVSADGLKVDEARSSKWHNAFNIMRGIQAQAEELRKTGSEITMEEMVSDMEELRHSQREYNTDLLGTMGMYNTLLGKSKELKGTVGKSLIEGLGDESTRRGIAKTIAGMGESLSDSWKSVLGGGGAQGIFEFEKFTDPQKFKAVGKFIQERVGGGINQQLLAARNILSQMGFGPRESKKMAEWLTGGGGKTGLEKAVAEMEQQAEEAKKQVETEANNRQKLLDSGVSTATSLTSIQQLLIEKFEPYLKHLVEAMDWIVKALMSFAEAKKTVVDKAFDFFNPSIKRQQERDDISQAARNRVLKQESNLGLTPFISGPEGKAIQRRQLLMDIPAVQQEYKRVKELTKDTPLSQSELERVAVTNVVKTQIYGKGANAPEYLISALTSVIEKDLVMKWRNAPAPKNINEIYNMDPINVQNAPKPKGTRR